MKFFYSLMTRKALPYLLFLFFPLSAIAQTNTWTGAAGNNTWQTAGNWSLNNVPTYSHDVVINTNATIRLTGSGNANSLTISGGATVTLMPDANNQNRTVFIDNSGSTITAGSTLNLTGFTGGAASSTTISFSVANSTFTIAGNLNLNVNGAANRVGNANFSNSVTTVSGTITNYGGTITSTAANLSFLSGGSYVHARNGGAIPTASWNAASNCNITGITGTAPTGLNQAFGNLTWDCIGQTTGFLLAQALTTINGTFTVGNTNIFGLFLASTNNANYTLNIGGDLIINDNAWLAISSGDNVTATINVAGNFTMSGAAANTTYFDYHTLTGGAATLNKIIMNVSGDFSVSGGLLDFAFGASDAANFTELRLGGNLSVTGNGAVATTTTDNSITNGTITFNKAGTQTITVAAPGEIAYVNYIVGSGSTTRLLSNLPLSSIGTAVWAGRFTVNSGGILDAGTNQLLSSTGAAAGTNNTFTLNSGAGLITANVNGVQNANIGTISTSIATSTFSSAANYTFNGTATQNSGIFTTTPTANQVNNLIVNNTAGSATTGVTLQQPIAVNSVLTLTSGHITSTAVNLLTLNSGSSVNGQNYATRLSGGSDNSFVNGPMRKIGNSAFLFPVGKVGGGHHYCGLSAGGAAGDTYTAEYMRQSAYTQGNVTTGGLAHVSNCEYWNITTTVGSPNKNVTLSWSGTSNCSAAVYVNDFATLVIAHNNGAGWNSFGGFVDGGSTAPSGSVTWNNVNTFSPFTLGSTSQFTNPLPVKLINVKAYRAAGMNRVEWTNLTESDVAGYEVQRSLNGSDFTTVATVSPRSNNNDRNDYHSLDIPTGSVVYYRIKAVGNDRKVAYSVIVKVSDTDVEQYKLVLYPNPVTGKQFTLQMSMPAGEYTMNIYGANGQTVKTEKFRHAGGTVSRMVDLPQQLNAGQYYLQLKGAEQTMNSKFILQ